MTVAAAVFFAAQVIRGYIGDRSSGPVFEASSPFDILGSGYQRPFELATLRLFNMVGILPKCERQGVLQRLSELRSGQHLL